MIRPLPKAFGRENFILNKAKNADIPLGMVSIFNDIQEKICRL